MMIEPPFEQHVGRKVMYLGVEGRIVEDGDLAHQPIVFRSNTGGKYVLTYWQRGIELIDEKPDNTPLPLPG